MVGKEILMEMKGDDVAVITFNRPEAQNALNHAMVEKLEEAWDEVAGNEKIRALILTGAGENSFLAGSDIAELSKRTPLSAIENSMKRQGLLDRLANLGIATIAAVNGYAFGFGCEIALACTLRLASAKAKFGQLEINLGIIPGAGGTQRLPRLIGRSRAAELILTGRMIDAAEACQIGLINKMVPPEALMDESIKLAQTIAEKSAVAVRYALMAINGGLATDEKTGLRLESFCLGACFASQDSKEGLAAFLEKRKPKFCGR